MFKRLFLKKKTRYFVAFLLPMILTLVFFASGGIYPFGEYTILTGDLRSQFIEYFAHLKNVIREYKPDMFYTLSKTLGGDYTGLKAYYLNNPLLLVLFLFPGDSISYGIEAVVLLQTGLAGLFSNMLLDDMDENKWYSLVFSTAFAMNGFIFGDLVLLIYFSNIAILPLVVLFFRRMMTMDKGYGGFIITSALSVFMSYYQGYMLMIFMVLIFAGYLASDIKYLKRTKKVIFSVAISLMLVSFELIPTVLSLKGEKSTADADFGFYRKFSMIDFLNAFIPGRVNDTHLPLVYCSVFAVICALIYILGRRRRLKDKLQFLIPFIGLILSMYINTFDAVWHGFNNPVGFPFRYAYMLSFVMICMGYLGMGNVVSFLSDRLSFGTKGVIYTLLCMEVAVELVCSDHHMYEAINSPAENALSVKEFRTYHSAIGDAVKSIKEKDPGEYRIEKDFAFSLNDPMLFDYYGLSHSSSCEKVYINSFMQKMGFRDTGLYSFYSKGSTSFANSILGVKYLISMYDVYKDFEEDGECGQYKIYRNDNALPLIFNSSKDILKVNMEEKDPFRLQNDLANRSGATEDIYIKAESEQLLVNAKKEKDKIIREDPDEVSYVSYKITAPRDGVLYFYFDAPEKQQAVLYVNGENREGYFTENNWSVYTAGEFKKGESVDIRLELMQDEIEISDEYFYFEDTDSLRQWSKAVRTAGVNDSDVNIIKSSRINMNVEMAEGDILVFAFPYDKGWRIYIDGKRTKAFTVADALMGIEPSAGAHSIEMRYTPEGLIPGIIVSIAGLAAFVLFMHFRMKDGGENETDIIGRDKGDSRDR